MRSSRSHEGRIRKGWIRQAIRVSLALALPLAAAIGCNAILGSTSFTCATNSAGACPDGQSCNVTTGTCVAQPASGCGVCPSGDVCDDATNTCKPGEIVTDPDGSMMVVITDSGTDAQMMMTEPDGATMHDAAVDAADASPPPPVGSPCTANTDCTSGLCATSTLVGTLATSGSFCTSTCCTSDECAMGAACVNMGTGGSYCVPGSRFAADGGRDVPATGGGTIGATCNGNSDCKSGVCHQPVAGEPGSCTDSCCSNAQCNGGNCAYSLSREKHDGFNCLPADETGSDPDGSTCSSGSECASLFCSDFAGGPSACHDRCCGSASCGAGYICLNQQIPDTANGTDDYVGVCFARSSTTSGSTYSNLFNDGTGCTEDSQCKSGICDDAAAGSFVCVDSCCLDSDCSGGQVCRPRSLTTPLLRCVPQ